MPMNAIRPRTRTHRQDTCNDQVVGAILSGWRYDISGISPDLRGDYEEHLASCAHCRKRQQIHRTIDVLLLAVTTLAFVAFLLAALVMHRLEALSHITSLHVPLRHEGAALALAHVRIPDTLQVSLEAVAIAGVVISMLLWVLVAIATPIPAMVAELFRERVQPEIRDRWRQKAA